MAHATASPSPNPNAMKFTVDAALPQGLTVRSGEDAPDPFTSAVLGTPGVAAVFLNGDFFTVTREPGAEWEPIISAAVAAAKEHL